MAEVVTVQPNSGPVKYATGSDSPAIISHQPTNIRSSLSGALQGLEVLTQMETLILKEERDVMERILGDKIPCGPWGACCGPPEKRFSGASAGNETDKIFWLQESSSCLPRRCWPRMRSLNVVAKNPNNDKEMFRIVRDVSCGNCCIGNCFPMGCCGFFGNACADTFKLSVTGPDHSPFGYVEQRKSCLALEFQILNKQHQVQYTFKTGFTNGCLDNPCYNLWPCLCWTHWLNSCGDVVAPLKDSVGNTVGSINWKYPGLMDSFVCNTRKFGITFPAGADAEMRATLTGATLLLENFFGTWNPVFCCPLIP